MEEQYCKQNAAVKAVMIIMLAHLLSIVIDCPAVIAVATVIVAILTQAGMEPYNSGSMLNMSHASNPYGACVRLFGAKGQGELLFGAFGGRSLQRISLISELK